MTQTKTNIVWLLRFIQWKMVVCENCDEFQAKWTCNDCSPAIKLCDSCRDLHVKFKAFKSHSNFCELCEKRASIACSNCEKAPAKFYCEACTDESERYFCLGCSLFHNKIKAFRSHSVLPMEESQDGFTANSPYQTLLISAKAHLDRIGGYVQDLVDGKAEASLETKILITVSAVLMFLLCKFIFGSSSMVVNMGAVAGVYYYLQKRKEQQLKSRQNILQNGLFSSQPSESISSRVSNRSPFASSDIKELEKQFPDEFPYELHGKQASLRRRGRPFQPRPGKPKTKSPSNLDGENFSDDEMIPPSKARNNHQ